MTTQRERDLEALLDGVWQRRRPELIARVRLLTSYLDAIGGDPSAWQALGAEAHRLVGALGSLGFADLAQAVRTIEVEVCSVATAPGDVSALQRVAAAVQDALATSTSRPRP